MRYFQFTKMQGLGNDFVVLEGPMSLADDEIAWLCDRRHGVGADGVLVITQVDPVRMEYWNADGSAAEMCGNGLRCVARYAYDKGWATDRNFAVATPLGLRTARILGEDIEVELGRAKIVGSSSFNGLDFDLVDVGNPHAVAFVDDPDLADVAGIGRSMQSQFETGGNVEFVAMTEGGLTMRVWERGVGETLACGTGMAAAATVANAKHGVPTPIPVTVPGGQASIDIRDGVVWLRGPANYSFRGNASYG